MIGKAGPTSLIREKYSVMKKTHILLFSDLHYIPLVNVKRQIIALDANDFPNQGVANV